MEVPRRNKAERVTVEVCHEWPETSWSSLVGPLGLG
jgi:hypothetical protein